MHAITPAERQAVLELFERWGDIDGGYRKLAHRGSYEKLVWVSPSTLYRVLAAQGLVLPARAQRAPAPARPLPDWIEWRRHQIWIYDITHFPRAGRVAYAILDVVTRKWLATLVTVEETATQVEVVFTDALDSEGLWPAVEARQAQRARHGDDSDEEPILLAMSDNGPQMRAGTTREFLAMCSIAARFGRPGTPTDQAWIETLFGHVKTEWPHLEKITDPNTLRAELDNARTDYNTRRLHASLGYVTPDDEHQGRGDTIRQAPPRRPQTGPASPASPTIATTTKTSHEHTRPMRRNQTPQNGHLLRSTSLVIVRQLALGTTLRRPRGATDGAHGQRPELVEGETPLRVALERLLDAVQLGVAVGIVGLLPRLGPLERDVMAAQDLAQPLGTDRHRPVVVVAETAGQFAQTPPRESQPQRPRARRGRRDDEVLICRRDPAGTATAH